MEIDKMSELKEEPHLSGAYIRTLVKQLTTSRTKSPKDPVPDTAGAGRSNGQKTTKLSQGLTEPPQNHRGNPPQQHKKQVRRRLHSSKPYQERMLNMAEARREIVTALKFHRAAMKQANEQHHLSSPPSFEDEPKTKSRINSGFCPSPSNPCSWPVSATPFPSTDTLDFTLPNQTLGLSLNFQDFNNIETNLYHNSNNSSSSPYVTQQVPSVTSGEGHHQAMEDEGITGMRSLGEQHQMEWNDTVDLVTSAWWLNFMKTMELGVPEPKPEEDEHGFQPFDQIMEFPAWLKSNDTGLQHHFNDVCPDDYFQVPALPCMDIGEIEGMDDVEWLA
ncbi:hypothetical protein like AT5G21280 [Hibiscus trionum]|uniref:Hydroxyproline-rich glycoprotein family protein n=1 Tax=Hibiscus trionum TaxID=183268 RepID=A0A9W7I418_HIBTR|nr:hypothetical protein like AT5G21280 [Hibiscus trionum]